MFIQTSKKWLFVALYPKASREFPLLSLLSFMFLSLQKLLSNKVLLYEERNVKKKSIQKNTKEKNVKNSY